MQFLLILFLNLLKDKSHQKNLGMLLKISRSGMGTRDHKGLRNAAKKFKVKHDKFFNKNSQNIYFLTLNFT